MSKVRLQDLTWVEAEEKMKAGVPVIVPFGSQEQHGPHAPMGDFIITEAVAVAAAERAGAIVAPVIAGGCSGCFRPYPGTSSLRSSTLGAVLEITLMPSAQGFERISSPPQRTNGTTTHRRKIRDERGLRAGLSVSASAHRATNQLFPSVAGSLRRDDGALYSISSESCRWTSTSGKYHDWNGLKVTGLTSVDFKGYPIGVHFNYDEITDPTGVVGDGNEATAEKGKIWFDYIVEGAAGFVEWSKKISWKVD